MEVDVKRVDYSDPKQCDDLLLLLDAYAQDPMGGGESLKQAPKQNLIKALQARPFMRSFICYVDGQPAGFANCIESFSTFKCQAILNIHDFAVNPQFRGMQLSQTLMTAIEQCAAQMGCCKITLEVLEGNVPAQNAYIKAGFKGYELDPEMGKAMFWEKSL